MEPHENKRIIFSTPWFSLVSRGDEGQDSPYYAVESADAVTILAVTREQRILLIDQFRPAHDSIMRELPSGHIEPGERPEDAAGRELLEETGYAHESLELLGVLVPDTGRLAYRLWVYFAPAVREDGRHPREHDIALSLCTIEELMEDIRIGKMIHAADIAAVFLAMQHKRLPMSG
jgi:ADP-ribose pyrophosphatase